MSVDPDSSRPGESMGAGFLAAKLCGLGLLCYVGAWQAFRPFSVPQISAMLLANSFVCAGLRAGIPDPFCKNPNLRKFLRFRAWRAIILGPYLLATWSVHWVACRLSREAPFDEVAPGVFVGRKLHGRDRAAVEHTGFGSVLDLAAEFDDPAWLKDSRDYHSEPLPDTCSPTPVRLAYCCRWIECVLPYGAVFVHCASGHGRSATVAAAWVLWSKQADTVDHAIESIRSRRPGIHINGSQRRALEDFYRSMVDGTLPIPFV